MITMTQASQIALFIIGIFFGACFGYSRGYHDKEKQYYKQRMDELERYSDRYFRNVTYGKGDGYSDDL